MKNLNGTLIFDVPYVGNDMFILISFFSDVIHIRWSRDIFKDYFEVLFLFPFVYVELFAIKLFLIDIKNEAFITF